MYMMIEQGIDLFDQFFTGGVSGRDSLWFWHGDGFCGAGLKAHVDFYVPGFNQCYIIDQQPDHSFAFLMGYAGILL